MDLTCIHHALMSFIGALLLPVFILAVLACAMGGAGGASMGEAIADALGTFLVIVMEILLRIGATICFSAITILSALVRFLALWLSRRKVRIVTGQDDDQNASA